MMPDSGLAGDRRTEMTALLILDPQCSSALAINVCSIFAETSSGCKVPAQEDVGALL